MSSPDYKLVSNYRNNSASLHRFHKFISLVFPGISFVEWHRKGFWKRNYIPYSLVKGGEIVSNVCITNFQVWVNGEKKKALQLGAVGTLPEYRNRGLSRQLMNYVIEKYQNKVDLFFLYANESVLEFYPKFGFQKILEYQFTSKLKNSNERSVFKKLDLSIRSDFKMVKNLISNRVILSKNFSPMRYGFITWWHILNNFKNDIYALPDENIIIIKKEMEGILHLLDVIYTNEFELETMIAKIPISNEIGLIKFYFPTSQLGYSCDSITNEDTNLFILGNAKFNNEPFRFPETAIT